MTIESVGDERPVVDASAVFRDAVGELARGTHRRAIVNMRKMKGRLRERHALLAERKAGAW